MKLSAVFLFAVSLQVSARTWGQTVTLDLNNVPVQKVFKEASRQTGISIIYNEAIFNGLSKVTIKVKEATIQQVLDQCLKDQPFAYALEGNMIVINKKAAIVAVTPNNGTSPPLTDIHGRVTDSLGSPLAGASVTVKGLKRGVQTSGNGNFELKGVADNATLVISFTGFATREYRVEGQSSLNISLSRSNSSLDDVQVIAYGNTTERLSTGNVTTIKSEDIEKQPVDNLLLSLEGRVPGLLVTQATGLPGSGITVQIQGQNSINNGNDPLYVIDDVPYSSQLLTNLSAIVLGNSGGAVNGTITGGGNPMSYINPSDIESISILKDADATAIYGSRAANGAILVTTRRGRQGTTKIDLNAQSGVGNITRRLKLLNAQQYLGMRHEAISNDGLSTGSADFDLNGLWDTSRYTDWQKTLIGGSAKYTTLSATISGGNANTQYLLSGTFHRETPVFPGDFSDRKGSVNFNLNTASSNQAFKLQFTTSYLFDYNQLPTTDLTSAAIHLAPDAPKLYNADGSLNWELDSAGSSTWTNPISNLYNTIQSKANNLVSNAILTFRILPGLDISSSFGYTYQQLNEIQIDPEIAVAPDYRQFIPRTAFYLYDNLTSWIVEPQLKYKTQISKVKLDFLLGSTIEEKSSSANGFVGSGYNNDLVLTDISSAANISASPSTLANYRYNALFGRLSFSWDDEYLLNLTARRDGSSRFGPANQFHNFGAIGAGWIFSKTAMVRDLLPVLSLGKLKASYGVTGNDQIGDYSYLNLYTPVTVGVAYQGATGLQVNGLTNPGIQWEQTTKLELGLDLGFLKDRILLNADYYLNRSSNQLLPYQLPIITGFTNILRNFPATVQNDGFEASLSTTNIRSGKFSWTTTVNLTVPQNKLVSFPNLSSSTFANTLVIGKPITSIKVFRLSGVDPTTGEYKFYSKTDPYNPVNPDDLVDLVNKAPKYYGGFDNTFTYRSFSLDVLLQFVKQVGSSYIGLYPGTVGINQPVSVLGRWLNRGSITIEAE